MGAKHRRSGLGQWGDRLETMAIKKCRDCGEEKPLSEFYKQNQKGNLSSYCKPCHHKRSASYQKPNRKEPTAFGQGFCGYCEREFHLKKPWQKFCSTKCQYTSSNAAKRVKRDNEKDCARCGKSLAGKKSHAIYCSKTCNSMDHTLKHRSKTRVVAVARRNEIYLRDNKKCYICETLLGAKDFELDHLVPVARGGDNSPENLAVCCTFCNRSKGTKLGVIQLKKLFELRPVSEHH
jgi:5-methylcytosine-specific restriction endonuclease McrA